MNRAHTHSWPSSADTHAHASLGRVLCHGGSGEQRRKWTFPSLLPNAMEATGTRTRRGPGLTAFRRLFGSSGYVRDGSMTVLGIHK